MREIKYQGIYRPTGEKFEVYKLDILNGIVHGSFDGNKSDWCLYSVTPFGYGDAWVREYTGMKDKNDVEIYSGDIVKYKKRNLNQAFGDEDTPFYIEEVRVIEFSNYSFNVPQGFVKEVEIIGNTFSSPKLLTSR